MGGADAAQDGLQQRVERLLASAHRALASDQPLPSPCTSVCRMRGDTALCEGCYRTLDEIVAWSSIGDEGDNGKRSIWANISQRARQALA